MSISCLQNWGDSATGNLLQLAHNVLSFGLQVFLLARFGLLALAVALSTESVLIMSPLAASPSAWYFGHGAMSAAFVLALAGFCAYTATGGQRVFKEGFFGDE